MSGREYASSATPLLRQGHDDAETQRTKSSASSTEHLEDEWGSEDNDENPRNWPDWYKWVIVSLVSFIEFLTTFPNFMYAPNISDAQRDLGTSDDTLATFSLSIYILGFALGPLLFGPLSELYGRANIYRSCLLAFLAMTVGCALSTNIGMLIAFRFLAGSFGAAPVAIGGAVVGDVFSTEKRGAAMSVYQSGLIISAVIGPPLGGLIGSHTNWRWVFWIVCILTTLASACTFFLLRETHAPTLKRSLAKADGASPDSEGKKSLFTEIRQALNRPLRLLIRSPVVFSCCVLIFMIIGFLNLFLTLMSRVFQEVYHMSSGQSGTVYFGLAFGFVLASATFGATNDRIMRWLTRKYKGETQPEFRLPATIVAMPLITIGLLVYGWTLQFRTHWAAPIVGSGIAGLGITTVQLSITTYVIDSFDEYSASALAAITMARSVGGAVVTLPGPALYKQLGWGWGNTVFAVVNLLCCALPIALYRYGSRWRAMFRSEDL